MWQTKAEEKRRRNKNDNNNEEIYSDLVPFVPGRINVFLFRSFTASLSIGGSFTFCGVVNTWSGRSEPDPCPGTVAGDLPAGTRPSSRQSKPDLSDNDSKRFIATLSMQELWLLYNSSDILFAAACAAVVKLLHPNCTSAVLLAKLHINSSEWKCSWQMISCHL